MNFMNMVVLLMILSCLSSLCFGHGHESMSKMRVSRSIDSDLIVMVAETTQGPYAESLSDYVNTSNILTAAKSGGPGVSTDRSSVLDGIPLNLTINVYSVEGDDDSIADELEYADVYIWHCDSLGIYSAVSSSGSTQREDTEGQKWLRGVQNTGKNGQVTFQTIIPGWYTGRILHYHIRVHLLGQNENTFLITTQFFISQQITDTIKVLSPYVNDKQTLISYSDDNVYTSVPVDLRDKLILDLSGSPTAGYTSTFNIGIELQNSSTSTTTTPSTTTGGGGNGLMTCEQCEDNCQKSCKSAESKDSRNKCKKECRKVFCEPYFC